MVSVMIATQPHCQPQGGGQPLVPMPHLPLPPGNTTPLVFLHLMDSSSVLDL